MKPAGPWGVMALGLLLVAAAWGLGFTAGRQRAPVQYRQRRDTLRLEIRRLDTLYRTDTLRLWRLVRQVDTLLRVDSIPVVAADSARADQALRLTHGALTACAATVQACEQRVAAERRLRVLAESAAAAGGRRPPPGRAFAAGALAGAVTVLLLRR